ncbi:MAG: hydroxyacylglutathione hydrolase [Pseudomonadota bacterium]
MRNPVALPSFTDNYIWLLPGDQGCWVVDPGDATAVMNWLEGQQQQLAGILLTHHHADHTGGAEQLSKLGNCPVWGPDECRQWRTQAVDDQQLLMLDGLGPVQVLSVAAHTRGHVAYYLPGPGWLFCGDTLFSAGCGRLFEGTATDLQTALACINALPAETLLFPTHEYTLSNLRFARHVEPGNAAMAEAEKEVQALRQQGEPSLPTNLARERSINPFLRTHSHEIRAQVAQWSGLAIDSDLETLRLLRLWKDQF